MNPSREVDLLREVSELVGELLATVELAAREPKRAPRMIDLAVARIGEWGVLPDPKPEDGDDLDESQRVPTVASEEGKERIAVARMAVRDGADFQLMLDAFRRQAHLVVTTARRYTRTVDASKLPKDTTMDRCSNCIQAGHWAPVRVERQESGVSKHGLCDWCWRHALADGRERGLDRGELGALPPLEAVKLYHERSPAAAGRWLAEQARKAARRQGVAS